MGNLYDVHARGKVHPVETPHHHDDFDAAAWKKHMVDILKQVVSNLTVQEIERIVHRGRR